MGRQFMGAETGTAPLLKHYVELILFARNSTALVGILPFIYGAMMHIH